MKIILILFLIFSSHFSLSAPFPTINSTELGRQKPGLYFSPEGFSLHAGKTTWEQKETPLENKNILAFYKAPKKQASLTVRIDRLERKTKLDNYVKSWKKDYVKFGMDIVDSKKVKVGKNRGYMIDLLNNSKNKFIRQIVFLKSKKAVVMTCRSDRKSLKKSLPECNQIFKNFQWL